MEKGLAMLCSRRGCPGAVSYAETPIMRNSQPSESGGGGFQAQGTADSEVLSTLTVKGRERARITEMWNQHLVV